MKKRPSKEVDEKFAKATKALSGYEMRYHPRHAMSNDKQTKTVLERIEAAEAKDKSTSTILNRLKETFSQKVRLAHIALTHTNTVSQARDDRQPEPTTVIEFLLCKSLPDESPTIVRREH